MLLDVLVSTEMWSTDPSKGFRKQVGIVFCFDHMSPFRLLSAREQLFVPARSLQTTLKQRLECEFLHNQSISSHWFSFKNDHISDPSPSSSTASTSEFGKTTQKTNCRSETNLSTSWREVCWLCYCRNEIRRDSLMIWIGGYVSDMYVYRIGTVKAQSI